MGDPRGFLKFPRETASRRSIPERLHDWREMYEPMPEAKLKDQAARCMDCGVPFCQSSYGCPVENLIPEWNDLVHRGLWQEALQLLHSTNNFPDFTGRLCPAPCESACVLGINQDPVAIRQIELSIIERGFTEGWVKPLRPSVRTGRKIAVIGSGPAGLAAAQELARKGHEVTVFEKENRIGGLLRYGIPEFKMEKSVLDRRLAQLSAEGVEFITDTEIGGNCSARELRGRFDAICLTIGAEAPRDLGIPGRELKGIHPAMEYLVQQNRLDHGDRIPEAQRISAKGKHVVIIGGGDTGSDCLGTAHRQGCLSAHQLEILPAPPAIRSGTTPWPMWPLQLRTSHAHEEGGVRKWSVSTLEFLGESSVRKLRIQEVRREISGFVPVPGTETELEADLVLLALGFQGPVRQGPIAELGVQCTPRGTIEAGPDFQTNVPGVFAAGDAKLGASLIVWAIAEGRKMAASVHDFVTRN